MIKIKFNNNDTKYDVELDRINDNVLYVIGNVPSNKSGFKTYDEDGVTQLGDFSDYITIYRKVEDGVQFSNDGSTYKEPTKNVIFNVTWNDQSSKMRPKSINAIISDEYDATKAITIKASEKWQYELSDVPVLKEYNIIKYDFVNGYSSFNDNHTITYNFIDDKPTWPEEAEAQYTYTAMMTDTLLDE